jgi:2-polyprenyl-6-methoxyphenol hydroxylase-like FAD-dependent oxidoreductase
VERFTDRTPVLIAGAGPAGLAAASELAHHGIHCVVVEPRSEVSTSRPRAKTTSVRTMEHMRRWGVADALRQAAPLKPSWSQRVTFCESLLGNRVTDIEDAFGLTAFRDDRFAEAGQQVSQPVIEQVLRNHLTRQDGAELRFGWKVTGAALDEGPQADGALVYLEDPAGARSAIRAKHVLACDGHNSVLRDVIGARMEGATDFRPNFNVMFRAPGLDTPLGPAVQYWVVGKPTAGVIGRLDQDGTWWAIVPGVAEQEGRNHAVALVHDLIGGDVPIEILATDTWTARMMVADRFQRGPVYLVGESAHVNPPWGGHGYNTCIGDAVNVGWKIAAVEHGWAGRDLLLSYEAERRGVVEQTISNAAHNMQALAGDLARDPDAIRAVKEAEFHSLGLVLGYTYAGSPVIQDGPAPAELDTMSYIPTSAPGSRLPHFWMPDGSSLYDRLGRGLTLLCPAGADAGPVAELRDRARALGVPLTVLRSPEGYPWAAEFLLVRPDEHIAWRASDARDIDLVLIGGRPDSASSGA